jgi:thiosulfate/3-mercaptopyruvate sulfurtransferase
LVSPLIDLAELGAGMASADPPVLLDVRWSLQGGSGRSDYEAGHIPGAAFLDLDVSLAGEPGAGGRHPLPDPVRLEQTLRDLGVRAGEPVVVYDAGGVPPTGAAARAWLILRWAGHDEVRVLDGGYAAWVNDARAVSTESVERPRGDVTVRPGSVQILDAAGAAERAAAHALIDVRIGGRYRGEVEPVDKVAGHIPGAVNLPLGETTDRTGRMHSAEELRVRFARLRLPVDQPIGAYCGSGVAASHAALALTVAGYEPIVYVGSWSEWISDENRPIAKGDLT